MRETQYTTDQYTTDHTIREHKKDLKMTALTLFHNFTLKQLAIQYTIYHINDRLVILCTS